MSSGTKFIAVVMELIIKRIPKKICINISTGLNHIIFRKRQKHKSILIFNFKCAIHKNKVEVFRQSAPGLSYDYI